MGLEFLARVRHTSLWLGALGALVSATYVAPNAAMGIAAGCAWSLVNLFLLQHLVVGLTGPDRKSNRALVRSAISGAGMLGLFGLGAWLLMTLPPIWLTAGFVIPFGVMVLKAASQLLVQSALWQRFVRNPRRSGAMVVIAVAVIWGAMAWAEDPQKTPAEDTHGATATEEHAAPGHGDEEHAVGLHGEEEHGGGHESEGPQKFANVITILYRAFPDAGWAHWLHEVEVVVWALFIAVIICFVTIMVTRNAKLVPGRLQSAVEMLFVWLHDFIVGILGEKHGPRFVPFLGTLFIYILLMNLAGLIPFWEAPTSSLNVTVALALTVFVYSQWVGFRELGVVGWLDHLAGNPRTMISWLMVPLMLPIHVLGEIAKPISLAARLFGNVFGEDMLLVAFATLGVTVLAATGLPIGLPLHLPFLFLALLTSTIQALVFTVLSTIYLLLMLPHDDHEHEHEEAVQSAH